MTLKDIVKWGAIIALVFSLFGCLSERKKVADAKLQYEHIAADLHPDTLESNHEQMCERLAVVSKDFGFRLKRNSVTFDSALGHKGRTQVLRNRAEFRVWSFNVLLIPRPIKVKVATTVDYGESYGGGSSAPQIAAKLRQNMGASAPPAIGGVPPHEMNPALARNMRQQNAEMQRQQRRQEQARQRTVQAMRQVERAGSPTPPTQIAASQVDEQARVAALRAKFRALQPAAASPEPAPAPVAASPAPPEDLAAEAVRQARAERQAAYEQAMQELADTPGISPDDRQALEAELRREYFPDE